MKKINILITGGCGFVGTNICVFLKKNFNSANIFSLDNCSKIYSKNNLQILNSNKIFNYKISLHDKYQLSKLKTKFDYVIDCAGNPAVESSRKKIEEVFDSNLVGTFNLLQKVKSDNSKIIFFSTSRVYPIEGSYEKFKRKSLYNELDTIEGPKTVYGFTKLASEMMIKEFSYAFDVKYIINRFGLITGPLQFGKIDQGLVSLWMWRHLNKKFLEFKGYNGNGIQVRDILNINDVSRLIMEQIQKFNNIYNLTFCVGGGKNNSVTLKQLTNKCKKITHFSAKIKKYKKTSIYDVPYFISSNKKIYKYYNWRPKLSVDTTLIQLFNWMKNNYISIKSFF
jgi:CDP-paratose 2-epimerase